MQIAIAPIVDRLRGAGLKSVEGLLELKAMTAAPAHLPAFYVVPTGETAQPNQLSGARDQRVQGSFSVIVVLGAGRRPDAINEALKAETARVIEAITGWTHPDAATPCDYAGGRLMSGAGSTVEWEVRFSTRYHLRRPS